MSTRTSVASSGTVNAARDALDGHRRGLRAFLPYVGPALIAAIAYVDPGNYATNIQSGATFGYNLLWVVLMANLMAMIIQTLSAKLGIATGKNLPELCRQEFRPSVSLTMWAISELGAMATDIAEFLGATIGLYLLFHIPPLVAGVITGVITYLVLMLDRWGFRPLEIVIGGLLGVIGLSYLAETFLSHLSLRAVAYHSVVPWMGGSTAIVLSVGIIGATVMPHVVYLHSGLTQNRVVPRNPEEAKRIHRYGKWDVIIGMSIAGMINMAMLAVAAAVFHTTGHSNIASITTAYQTLTPLLGGASAAIFLISLLASGVSSSAVGTMAGQVIMQGFVGFKIPVWIRRVVTMLPTMIIIALGLNPTATLIISQVILSLVLPFPVIALVMLTNRKDLMGALVNSRLVSWAAGSISMLILIFNAILLWQTFGLPLPFGLGA